MGIRHALRTLLRDLRPRRALERDLDDELRFHLEREVAARVARGESPAQAERETLRLFGSMEGVKDDCRDERGAQPFYDAMRDVHIALRGFLRRPAVPAVAVATLGIAIAATTSVFSVVDGVLLKPLPFRDADRLVTLWQVNHADGNPREEPTPGNFMDWKERARSFTGIAAARPFGLDYETRLGMETIDSWQVGADFFDVVGAPRALLGRVLQPTDFAEGHTNVVVLSHRAWLRWFGGDSTVVGRTTRMDGEAYTVVGVMPAQFELPVGRYAWHPKVFDERDRAMRTSTMLTVFGRLAPGVTLDAARREMDDIAAGLAREYPRVNAKRGATVVPVADALVGHARPALTMLLGAAGLLLLVACANVATLLMGRAQQRAHEMALRAAIGARRWRLVRQTLAESALLALVAAAVGVALSFGGVAAIKALGPDSLPRVDEMAVDSRAVVFAVVLALGTSLLFGILPALRESAVSPGDKLRSAAAGIITRRGSPAARRTLSALEVALSLVLLVGAGLLARSMLKVLSAERGYRTDHVLTFSTQIWQEYPRMEQRAAFVREVTRRLSGIPGVTAATTASALPLAETITNEHAFAWRPEAPPPSEGERPAYRTAEVGPRYFDAIGTPVVRGRAIEVTDDSASAMVAVVSERFARAVWPGEDALGRRLVVSYNGQEVEREVVGVVADVRRESLDETPQPTLYIPYDQSRFGALQFVVRTTADPMSVAGAVRETIRAVNPRLPLADLSSMEQLLDAALRTRRFLLFLLGAFAAISLVLAGIGVYGVQAQSAGERVREMAVRQALGARPREAARLILSETGLLFLIGAAAGVALAAAATRLLRSMLFEVETLDAASFVAAATLLAVVAVLGSVVPMRRAMRVDPARTLREG